MTRHLRELNKQGFTLIESLTVLVVIGLLLGISIQSFGILSRQIKLEEAAVALEKTLKFAREFARCNNQPTYLVFSEGQDDQSKIYQAYAVYSVSMLPEPITQKNGCFIKNWTALPKGILFHPTASENKNNVFLDGGISWNGGFSRKRRLKIGSEVYVALGFSPKGTQRRTWVNDIHLAEGHVHRDQQVYSSDQGFRIRLDSLGRTRISSIIYTSDTTYKVQNR